MACLARVLQYPRITIDQLHSLVYKLFLMVLCDAALRERELARDLT